MQYDKPMSLYVAPPPWMDSETLSSDPTCGRSPDLIENGVPGYWVHPHRLISGPNEADVNHWKNSLSLMRDPGPVEIAQPGAVCDLLIDFGTEFDGHLVVEAKAGKSFFLTARFGESLPETSGLIENQAPFTEDYWTCPGTGRHEHRFENSMWNAWRYGIHREPRGFRFARLRLIEARGPVTLRIRALALFPCPAPLATFSCDDKRIQRVWQVAAYTARLCTRSDCLWDGIKRDRTGWYGDARPIQATLDWLVPLPDPVEKMLARFPVNTWVNGVPVYSFDAIAMLRQWILAHPVSHDQIRPHYAKVREFLDWVLKTQTDSRGFITRDPAQSFFFNIGFVDWSDMPVGGRFEELSWLQIKHVEGLRMAAEIADWLGEAGDSALFSTRADALQERIIRVFWRPGSGFIHTLNHAGAVRNRRLPGYDGHYRLTYEEAVRRGPSGPTRQTNAWAVMAGLCDPGMRRTILEQVLNSTTISPIITPYFAWYEQSARALCGDRTGAVRTLTGYLADMIETENSPTLWEMWDPALHDVRRFCSSHEWGFHCSLSLCHGWGAGVIDLIVRHLMGISLHQPGWRQIHFEPASEQEICFSATLPSPHGMLSLSRVQAGEPANLQVPIGLKVHT